jgi:hypothetical protein
MFGCDRVVRLLMWKEAIYVSSRAGRGVCFSIVRKADPSCAHNQRHLIFSLLPWFLLLLLVLVSSFAYAQVDVKQIIERSVEANKADWKMRPEYDHSETVKKDGHTKTFDVLMILGTPYHRLTEIDGKPLSPQEKAQQEQLLQQAIARRKAETPEQKQSRIAAWQRSQDRDHFLMEQLTKAFQFKLEGTQTLEGHEVYVLAATPLPGYQPPNNEAKVLTGMKGKLWIDTATFQWVKVEAEVIHTVSIQGFLARVEPGTRFELQQAPVAKDVWFPTYFAVKSRAKVLFFFSRNSQEQDTYFNYRKASAANISAAQ